jgi:predicted nucleotidyltransferase
MPPDWLNSAVILEAHAGSTVYGTAIEDSDIDLRGLAVPPPRFFLGMEAFEQSEQKDPDRTIYGIRKWFRLAEQGNPNILELLWTPRNHYTVWTDEGARLVEHRDLFLGKHIKPRYIGYARSQLHRMKKLNKGANTNPKRVALVNRWGFDTKNAMHLVRLLRMGLEILTEQTLHVQRHDARDLLAIRNGEWSYERVIRESERIEALIDEAVVRCDLPPCPPRASLNTLMMSIVEERLGICWN